ncbi:hypothetical protein KY317_00470 [Candidatus Woesearchaeota archaeon]|nr:hypothetical protein [Candidatus Woesearchaeota archaeon]
MAIKESYSKLQKKYKLPKFEEINKEFEINSIEEGEFLLREIRRKIAEKIELYIKVIDGVLQPEPTIASLHEIKALSEKEKEKVYELYKKLMIISRANIETSVNESDSKTADYIRETLKQWEDVKHRFLAVIRKLKESWKSEKELKEELNYMG